MVNNLFDDGAFSEVFKFLVAWVLSWHKVVYAGMCACFWDGVNMCLFVHGA